MSQEGSMAKRLVEIDDDLLEQARQALGTSTIKETVNTALLEETVRAAWCRSITKEDLRRAGELLQDLGDPEIMAKAWE